MIQNLAKKILGDAQLAEMKTSLPLKERILKLEEDNIILIKGVDTTKLTTEEINTLGITEIVVE
jgi:hypothetical protein